ncbi:hypothetical protein QMM42_14345 [Leptospira santarosai]|uniref:Uncharacterized protein n=2 Tax=Leptospira santarosai TaxID=28183 RepID=A0A0E2BD15_9LEPT|nr:hypothetical protein [Leptospira santarosai]EKO32810.1 hypothetical protein LEP1GSC179_3166 [Leptospira santarosai str. MOR084]EMN23709.1 hypothetical protein LEP1GSC063_1475 [Leptospira santarosai serovar Arenal str. MAVJ 401]MDI7187371.1 hypothetical protein [Leptospira santarosai]MDI7201273.1 hypothetical protein [Leptospira santarosai]MDI7212303.1 hypothetical protein [Leptospira santarosai]
MSFHPLEIQYPTTLRSIRITGLHHYYDRLRLLHSHHKPLRFQPSRFVTLSLILSQGRKQTSQVA